MTNKQLPQPAQPSPFGGPRPLTSNSSGAVPPAPLPTPPGAPPAPPQSPLSRFASPFSPRQDWTITPVGKTWVRFDLSGLGDPFHRLLNHPLNTQFGDVKHLTKQFEQGGEDVDALAQVLNNQWQSYGLQGAVLLFAVNDNLQRALGLRGVADKTPPKPPAPAKDKKDDDDDDEPAAPPQNVYDQRVKQDSAHLLRAIDVGLTLNILGRTRIQLLLGGGELLLDARQLQRALITDDPRLVQLAKATGYIEV
jgi:hypothetical protein